MALPGFATPPPTPVGIPWVGLSWRGIVPDDALLFVSSVFAWRGGYVAVGKPLDAADALGLPVTERTPVWVSRDGANWTALAPAVFGPSTEVLGVAEVPGGLVALTAQAGRNECPPGSCFPLVPPLQSWTSPDGLVWQAHPGPGLPVAQAGSPGPFLASGPAGLVAGQPLPPAVTTQPLASALAVSADGVAWQTLHPAELAGIEVSELAGTPSGYVGVGARTTTPEHFAAVALWSADGQHWTQTTELPIAASSTGVVLAATGSAWGAYVLLAGSRGFLALGSVAAMPGAELWWQSSDGRHWHALSGFPPLGPTTCQGEGCGGQPQGSLGSDSVRMIALRGSDPTNALVTPGAWASLDGAAWQPLNLGPEGPSGNVAAVVLPGGVLVLGDTGAWFGQALTR